MSVPFRTLLCIGVAACAARSEKPQPVIPPVVLPPVVVPPSIPDFCPVSQPPYDQLADYRLVNTAAFIDSAVSVFNAREPSLAGFKAAGCDLPADVLDLNLLRRYVAVSPSAKVLLETLDEEGAGVWDISFMSASAASTVAKKALGDWRSELGLTALGTSVQGEKHNVVVIDAGRPFAHPMLNDTTWPDACFSTGGCGLTAIDACDETTTGAGNCGDCKTTAECQHGGGMTGVIAGHKPSGAAALAASPGIVSVAPLATPLSIRVLQNQGTLTPMAAETDLLAALKWLLAEKDDLAKDHRVVYMGFAATPDDAAKLCPGLSTSLGTSPISLTLADLTASGFKFVAPAGNAGYDDLISAPACYPGVISVTAARPYVKGKPRVAADWSNGSNTADMMAPGESVVGAAHIEIPTGNGSVRVESEYAWLMGSSVAAAQVAGALVLLEERMGLAAFTAKGEAELVGCLGGGTLTKSGSLIAGCSSVAGYGPAPLRVGQLKP